MNFLKELQRRNAVLYWFGWIYFIGGVLAAILSQTTDTIVLGINAWIKPMKFFSPSGFLYGRWDGSWNISITNAACGVIQGWW